MSKYSCSVWPYIQYFLPTSQVEILPLLQNSWYFFPSTIHIPARSGCSFHSTKVISTMQILIFQSAHKRNLYISQKIFGPSHKRYPPCPSHDEYSLRLFHKKYSLFPSHKKSHKKYSSHKKYCLRLSQKKYSLWPSPKKYSISEYIILLPISQENPLDYLSRNIYSTQPKSFGGGSWYKPWQSGFWSSGTETSSAWCGERERTPHTPHLAPPNRQHSPDFINISSLPHSPSPQDVHTSAPLLYQNPNLLVYIFIYILHHRSIPTRLCYNKIGL